MRIDETEFLNQGRYGLKPETLQVMFPILCEMGEIQKLMEGQKNGIHQHVSSILVLTLLKIIF